MKILTQIRFYLVIVTLAFIALFVNYVKLKDELLKCQTNNGYVPGGDIQKAQMQELIDSLHDENFISRCLRNNRFGWD